MSFKGSAEPPFHCPKARPTEPSEMQRRSPCRWASNVGLRRSSIDLGSAFGSVASLSASAEIKIDASQPVVAFGQAVAYRLFSHKSHIVVPNTTGADDMGRLKAICSIDGVRLVTLPLDGSLPNYTTVVLPFRQAWICSTRTEFSGDCLRQTRQRSNACSRSPRTSGPEESR